MVLAEMLLRSGRLNTDLFRSFNLLNRSLLSTVLDAIYRGLKITISTPSEGSCSTGIVSSPSEETLHPLAVSSQSRHPYQPYFLSLSSCLFQAFYINGIIQYVTLCDWLLSLRICLRFNFIVACFWASLMNYVPLYRYLTFYLSIHQLLVIDLFPLFGYYAHAVTITCVQVFVWIYIVVW